MAILTDFTTYDDIRAVLGVSDEELEDLTIALSTYIDQLELTLADIDAGLQAAYVTVAAKQEATRTVAEQKFYKLTRLFSSFAVARDLLTSLDLFAAKVITDGKASVQRFDTYEETRKAVLSMFSTLRKRLDVAYALIDIAHAPVQSAVAIFAVKSALAIDPVTGQ